MLEFLKDKKIMIVAAHPDDEILGVGGTINLLVNLGASIKVIILGEGLTSRSSTQPATTTAQNWQTIVNMLNNAGRKNSSSNQKNGDRPVTAMSAKLLCRRAVEIPNGEAMWEGDIKWKPEVDEAIRRGFSPKDCAEMTGRKVTVQRQPKKNSPSNGLTERLSKLKKLFDLGLINKSDYEKKKNEILKAL